MPLGGHETAVPAEAQKWGSFNRSNADPTGHIFFICNAGGMLQLPFLKIPCLVFLPFCILHHCCCGSFAASVTLVLSRRANIAEITYILLFNFHAYLLGRAGPARHISINMKQG